MVAFGIVLLGVMALAAIIFILDEPERRHRLHFWKAKHCGRCRSESNTKADDRAFNRSATHSALRNEIEAPE